MHDIWNPWHGCIKCTEDCDNCYMYYLDKQRGHDGRNIYRTKIGAFYPLQTDKNGSYKIKSGEMIRVCMNSDFFLKEADEWRNDAWSVIKNRPDVKFFLLTKRPERVRDCLPADLGNGWDNVMLNVTCENQKRADERIPILLELPFKHKGIIAAPFISRLNAEEYLKTGQIEQVICGGGNYDGARICNIPSKRVQMEIAYKSGMDYKGKDIEWHLTDLLGNKLSENELYKPYFGKNCKQCRSRPVCNGCSMCGKFENKFNDQI